MEFKKWLEQFDNAFDLLLNKSYSDKTFDQLMKDFKHSGGKIAGTGRYGSVFEHPNWKYVVKTFNEDNCYLRFTRFAYANPHVAFPKFFGPPQNIIPQFKRLKNKAKIYYVRIEKLFPIEESLAKKIVDNIHSMSYYLDADQQHLQQQQQLKHDYDQYEILRSQSPIKTRSRNPINLHQIDQHLLHSVDLMKQHPEFKSLAEGWKILQKHNFQCATDLHSNSVMKRENGQLVWIDPVWYGSNPYIDAQAAQRMETDSWTDDEPSEEDMIQGGKLPKKVKPKKAKPIQHFSNNDVPF